MMRSWLAAAAAFMVAVSLCLGAGCKGGAGTATGTQPESATKSAKAGEKDQKQKAMERKAGETKAEDVAKLLRSDNIGDQVNGLTQVGEIQSRAERSSLRKLVRKLCFSDQPQVRTTALGAWHEWVREDPEPALQSAKSPHVPVRLAAIRILSIGPLSAVQATLAKLKNDEDSTVAMQAAAALAVLLGASKADAGIDILIADLGHPEADRSAQAAMRLEQAGRTDRRVIGRLMAALRTSERPRQRMSCVLVIGLACAGTNEGQKKFASRARARYQVDVVETPAYTVPVPLLMKVVVSDPDPMVREAAAEALGHIGAPESAPALAKALADPDAMVRRRAASALIIVPPDPVKDELIMVARKDPSPEVRRFAVEAMAGLQEQQEAGLAVANCLRDANPDVRRYACEVLGRIGTRQFTSALLPLFEDPDQDVRWKAVEAVAGFVDPEARKALEDTLWDPSPRVALAAERGLHNLGIGKRVLTAEERTGPAHRPTR